MLLTEPFAEQDWNPLMDTAFHYLKTRIWSTLLYATLAYYDRTQPVIVHTNTSEYGLGATLIQSSWPITFAGKTLTDVETHYDNIERVPISVLWPQ